MLPVHEKARCPNLVWSLGRQWLVVFPGRVADDAATVLTRSLT